MKGSLENLRTLNSRASRLTRQLLTFSRRQPVRMTELDVRELLRNLSAMLGHLIGEHMQIEERFGPGTHWVKADAGMLEQLVTNLVVNARDAMQPLGGLITLGLESVVLAAGEELPSMKARPGAFVRLSVCDTGCGMSEEVQRRLFEPFFTTKEVGKGTGLGLATVFGIVQQHGGWIDVRSEPGRGSEFQVWLPQIVASDKGREAAGHSPLQRGRETLLVVEDDPLVRLATVAGLRACGYEVLTAANGPAALLEWERSKERIALLLTDVVMPEGMSGTELARQLRSEAPGLKVIFVSGYSREFNEEGCRRLDGAEYLSKPFELQQLTQLLRGMLGHG
jgi:CheY-like chemotaxis protein